MRYFFIFLFFIFNIALSDSKNIEDEYFFIGKMDSYNKDFTLYFKTREKAILSRGENHEYSINNFKIDENNFSYKRIISNTHPNFFIIDKDEYSEQIKIDQVNLHIFLLQEVF